MDNRMYLSLFVLVMWCCADMAAASSGSRCKIKHHLHKAVQIDLNGRRCEDLVPIQTCGGYCLSYEISHWAFPYKESHHPVCVHDERKHKSVKLSKCERGVEPGTEMYHYVDAASCKCQLCSSEDTSCEWLPIDTPLLGGLLLKGELSEQERE